jgi:hypothetical protein
VILEVAERDFGLANANILRGWKGHRPLSPLIDGKYSSKEGDFLPIPSGARGEPAPFLDDFFAVHLLSSKEFSTMVAGLMGDSPAMLEQLNNVHKKRYLKIFTDTAARLSDVTAEDPEKQAFDKLSSNLDWAEVAEILKILRDSRTGNSTQQGLAKDKWKTVTKEFAFPESWYQLAPRKFLLLGAAPQSQYANPAPIVEDDPAHLIEGAPAHLIGGAPASLSENTPASLNQMDETGNSVQVMYLGEQREVFAWRQLRQQVQFFIEIPTRSPVPFYDVVPAQQFRRTLKIAKGRPELDFSRMRGEKSFLDHYDMTDLSVGGIAMAKRPFNIPSGGFSALPHIFIFYKDQGGITKAFSRSDAASMYGKDTVDRMLFQHCGAAERPMVTGPMRKQLAEAYQLTQASSDSEDSEEAVVQTGLIEAGPPGPTAGPGVIQQEARKYRIHPQATPPQPSARSGPPQPNSSPVPPQPQTSAQPSQAELVEAVVEAMARRFNLTPAQGHQGGSSQQPQ